MLRATREEAHELEDVLGTLRRFDDRYSGLGSFTGGGRVKVECSLRVSSQRHSMTAFPLKADTTSGAEGGFKSTRPSGNKEKARLPLPGFRPFGSPILHAMSATRGQRKHGTSGAKAAA